VLSIRGKILNKAIKIGSYNTLKVARKSENGLYLVADDSLSHRRCSFAPIQRRQLNKEVLLPNAFVTDDMELFSEIKVFVYTDSEDRVVATTQTPKLTVGEFEFLEVVDVTSFGAFVDIGLQKDILVPKKMQKGNLKVGQKYLFALTVDLQSDRLIADMRIHRYLDKEPTHAKHLKAVELLIIAKTPMGYKVIANNAFEGMIYNNEIFSKVEVGQRLKGYLVKVRKDGKLDFSINPIGKNRADENSQKVIDTLKLHNGFLPFGYKSDANDIVKTFGMSKKAFKSSLTKLLETNKIILNETGVELK
jgi:predicted RNA-binding protein (virulence factor B family)